MKATTKNKHNANANDPKGSRKVRANADNATAEVQGTTSQPIPEVVMLPASEIIEDTTPEVGEQVQVAVIDAVPTEEVQKVEESECPVQLIDVNKIVTGIYNPRKKLREESLQELSDNIRTVGLLHPICLRPKQGEENTYEIVYGERRYWAAIMADLLFIPAIIRNLTDSEAEDLAISENLHRENISPREEGAAYKQALATGRHTIDSMIVKYGKSKSYIQSRLKICELIDEMAELLDKEEINIGVAVEVAKYSEDVQREVHSEHFTENCRTSWKNIRVKEIAVKLYDRYMTQLEVYNFNKTECLACGQNTMNQVLFKECVSGCGGCQNRECMIRKNNEFLAQTAIQRLHDDPRTSLATYSTADIDDVVEYLKEEGYEVKTIPSYNVNYLQAPVAPDSPKAEEFESEEEYYEAMSYYDEQLEEFKEHTKGIEFEISKGSIHKYAVIGDREVLTLYERIPEEVVETKTPEGRSVYVVQVSVSKKEELLEQDKRNRQLCYGHITSDLKDVIRDVNFASAKLDKDEEQMFHYAMMETVNTSDCKKIGLKCSSGWLTEEEKLTAAGHLTQKQRNKLIRYVLQNYFGGLSEYNVTDETPAVRLLVRFADLNCEKKSKPVQQKYLEIYEKRHARLQEQLDELDRQEAARAAEASLQPEPETVPADEPDTDTPEEYPFIEEPMPEPDSEPQGEPIEPDEEPKGWPEEPIIGEAA